MPSVREFHTHVLISFIWEKLLSAETVETGNVKPIEAVFCKFGNIVTSISFVMCSSCNTSSGFLASKIGKVFHSVCTSRDLTAVFTVSSSFRVRANVSFQLSKTSIDFFP